MKAYIGTPGRLIPLPYVTAQSVKSADDYTFSSTLEGRVKAQAKTTKRREWALSASRYVSSAQGVLMAFVNGEWGRGPFIWVSVDAQVTNLLTPDQSACGPSSLYSAGVTRTGPLDLGADGWAGRSLTNETPANPFYFGEQAVPVLPGAPFTASAYLVGAGAAMRVRWIDAAGAFISFSTGAATGVAGTARRAFVTAVPPTGAVLAQIQAINAEQGARPAVTWTAEMLEWAAGNGCPKCVVHTVSRDLKMVSPDPAGLRTADIGFTITEVG